MRRLETVFLSKVEVWIVVVMLTLMATGTVMFGAIVKRAVEDRGLLLRPEHSFYRVCIKIAEIPKTLFRLLVAPHPTEARSQRFNGQAGLNFANTVHFKEEGYLFLVRMVPKSAYVGPTRATAIFEMIDLSRRKTVHVWQYDTDASPYAHVLPDGSLIIGTGKDVIRLDPCSQVEWRKELRTHHSVERDADGNLWKPFNIKPPTIPGTVWPTREDGLLKFSPSGEVLSEISLSGALIRGGYRHLLYELSRHANDPFHINDIQPVLRDGPFWRRGDLFVSLRTNSVVLLYRPATDEVVWLRSGPWLHQHDVDIVSESKISVFSNNSFRASDGKRRVLGTNEVYIYDFATGEAQSPWREAMRRQEVLTPFMGMAVLLSDGGLIVEEHNYGRVLRMSADGTALWSYVNRASDGKVYQLGGGGYLDPKYGAGVMRSVATCTDSSLQASATHCRSAGRRC